MTHDTKTVAMLDDIRSLTYDVVERIAYGGQRFQLSDLALQKIQAARNAYEEAIAVSKVYAYGHNTDPGE